MAQGDEKERKRRHKRKNKKRQENKDEKLVDNGDNDDNKDSESESPPEDVVGGSDKPSDVIDLKSWKLTLPVGSASKPEEIMPNELAGFVDPKHFFVRDGAVVFRCPVNGVTTSGSNYPRTELREMDGTKLAVWSTSGSTSLEADLACTISPPVKPQVSLLQIHGGDDDVLQVLYDGTKQAITWRKDGTTQPSLLVENYQLGTRFKARIEVQSGTVRMLINSTEKASFQVNDDSCYWKTGSYVQSNPSKGDQPEAIGEVTIYSLSLNDGLKVLLPNLHSPINQI